MQGQILLVYLLLGAVGTHSHFMILLPAELRTDIPEKVCVLTMSWNESIALKLRIDYEEQNRSLLEMDLVGTDSHSCFSFTVGDRGLNPHQSTLLKVTVTGSGGDLSFNKTKRVVLKRYDSLTFVQTDKPIYKPGQTVRFRIVTLNETFIPIAEKYSLISVLDPQGNHIGQWKDVEPRQGIVDLNFDLIPEPRMGSYKIQVQKRHSKLVHQFQVEEYVLPTFEVKLDFPERITILDPLIHVKVCGRYTFGKPVKGYVNGSVCGFNFNSAYHCQLVFGETDSDGCLLRDLSTETFHLRRGRYHRDIRAVFTLKVEGTGTEIERSSRCSVINEITRINFEEMDSYFRKGLPYTGQLRIKHSTAGPIAKATIYLFNSMSPGAQKLISDQDGLCTFSFNTSSWTLNPVSFMAVYQISHDSYNYWGTMPRHDSARHQVKPLYSLSDSYLSIRKQSGEVPCDSDLEVTVDYIINWSPEEERLLDVSYLVMSRGLIVNFAKKSLSVGGSAGRQGQFPLTLRVSADLSPVARLLVFAVLPDGQTIANSRKYGVADCFRNKASLKFSVSEDLPSSQLSLDLQASPGSLCGVRVVDQSVLLLKSEKELSRHSVYSLLPVRDLSGYPYQATEDKSEFCVPEGSGIVTSDDSDSIEDTASILKDMGLKILTDTKHHLPVECEPRIERLIVMDTMYRQMSYSEPQPPSGPAVRVRQYFPETWIWDLIPVGLAGTASLPVTVPDSITEWKGSMFCTGEVGFGLSDTVSLNAFKPFFVDLALPYSVIRTESFNLKAKLFNYLPQCIMVQVSLIEAQGFEVSSALSTGHETCVCSKETVTFSWKLKATGLGEQNITVQAESIASRSLCGNELVTVPVKGAVDIIRKPLLIQPEGTETDLTHTSFLCPGGKTIIEKIHLEVPEEVVEGSSRAYITVLGDILGSAMDNLDGLLRLPTGCGEQNMVKFAPNIYVQRYLEQTNQLSKEVQAKAIGFLKTGYQRQLTFKHSDGSFSAFGEIDQDGNTWLTAFVLKSFLQARSFIFIDNSVLRRSTRFFLNYRLESGCFASVGQLFNNAMKGGIDDHVSLSAYVTTTLLELAKIDPVMAEQVYEEWREEATRSSVRDFVLPELIRTSVSLINETQNFKTGVTDEALRCLREAMETVNSTYTLALLAYTFTLAQDQAARDHLLLRLQARSIKQDGLTHWQRAEEQEDREQGFWWRAPSAEVEMTAYVLLALLSNPQVTSSDLDQAIPIVSWLVRQRNSYGGFTSTQDTVVALQALALYAQLTHLSDPHNSLTLSSEAGFHSQILIEASNQLLLQRQTLPQIPGDYSIEVTGTSCLLLQTSLRYNTPPAQKESVFTLSVDTVNHSQKPRIDINVTYTGERPVSNMVIVDVMLLSGYSPEKKINYLIGDNLNISKSEIRDGHMLLYIESMMSNHLLQLSIDAIQNFEVENLQPAHVKVYDYYETDDSAIAEYHGPITVESSEKLRESSD